MTKEQVELLIDTAGSEVIPFLTENEEQSSIIMVSDKIGYIGGDDE